MASNQITIHRSKHNRENPYAQISKEMLKDKSLSLKAKGLLSYLLSLPDDWQIYHSQLADALGVGETTIRTTLNELVTVGYAKRSRKQNGNLLGPYSYEISEFKEFLRDAVSASRAPRRENRGLQKTEKKEKDKQQTGAAAAQASPSVKAATVPPVADEPILRQELYEELRNLCRDRYTPQQLKKTFAQFDAYPWSALLEAKQELVSRKNKLSIKDNPLGYFHSMIKLKSNIAS